jgi:hypothetical protein
MDSGGKLWFLWCTSVRLEGGESDDVSSIHGHTQPLLCVSGAPPKGALLSTLAPIPRVITDPPRGLGSTGGSVGETGVITAAYPSVVSGGQGSPVGGNVGERSLGGGALGGPSHHATTYSFLADDKLQAPLVDSGTVSLVVLSQRHCVTWVWGLFVLSCVLRGV